MGLFDNADTVTINGKVVESIKTSDGGIIYISETEPIEKLDTHIEKRNSKYYLIDSNGNGVADKVIRATIQQFGGTITTNLHTYNDGYFYNGTVVSALFGGDDRYNGCKYPKIDTHFTVWRDDATGSMNRLYLRDANEQGIVGATVVLHPIRGDTREMKTISNGLIQGSENILPYIPNMIEYVEYVGDEDYNGCRYP